MMKKHLIFLVILFTLVSEMAHSQFLIFNYSIGDMFDKSVGAGSTILPDGTKVTVEFIRTAVDVTDDDPKKGPDMFKTGNDNIVSQHYLGGTFDSSPPQSPNAAKGTTLGAYKGSDLAAFFTTIQAESAVGISGGRTKNFEGSVGLRVHFSKPTVYSDFLFLDIDGKTDKNGQGQSLGTGNQEWSTVFAFNGNTYIPMTISPSTLATNLTMHESIHLPNGHAWKDMLRAKLGTPQANAFPDDYTNIIERTVEPVGGNDGDDDPDDTKNQFRVAATNEDAPITDFFVLWGIGSAVLNPSNNAQRSGMSPITVKLKPDFGDAPTRYRTVLKPIPSETGPSHGIVPELKLGTKENSELDGNPSANASHDNDDDGLHAFGKLNKNELTPTYTMYADYTNTTGADANIIVWFDIDEDGHFDSSEGRKKVVPTGGSGTAQFTWTNIKIVGDSTYVRVRITTEDMETTDVGGAFVNGEVEDYKFETSLPVTLTSFNAKETGNTINLSWKTASETNFGYFDILKSIDAKGFKSIGVVKGSGAGSYNFTDETPEDGNNYYRLKMVDIDESFELTRVINVNVEANKTFLIAENPTKGGAFHVSSNAVNPVFEMFTILGSSVEMTNSPNNGTSNYTFQMKKPTSGLYVLKMSSGGKILTKKIIIP